MGTVKVIAGTYYNAPMTKGRRGTCPYCLRKICVIQKGVLAKHGWHEAGRGTRDYARGAACSGSGARPIEETDRDALRAIEENKQAIEVYQAHEDRLEAGGVEELGGSCLVVFTLGRSGSPTPPSQAVEEIVRKLTAGEYANITGQAAHEDEPQGCAGNVVRTLRVFYILRPGFKEGDVPVVAGGRGWRSGALRVPGFAEALARRLRDVRKHKEALAFNNKQIRSRIFTQKAEDNARG